MGNHPEEVNTEEEYSNQLHMQIVWVKVRLRTDIFGSSAT